MENSKEYGDAGIDHKVGRGCFNCLGKFSARSKLRIFQTSNAEWQKILENSPGVLKKIRTSSKWISDVAK